METAIKVEHLSKQYHLGFVNSRALVDDFRRLLAKMQGKEDPFLKVGERNDRATAGSSEYVWALKDVSFDVPKGKVLGIIGKNGSGKSTLLKILSRVTGPTTGSVKMKGRVASLLEVGTGFHPELSGKENIFLNGAILGMTKPEIKRKYDEIVDFSGVERYIDTPVKRYSSGMYVRLAFGVAAHLEPEILIVDEVLAVGDLEFQKKCLGKMKDVTSQGRTVLFVSHNMAAVNTLCDSCMLLEQGQIKMIGDTAEVVKEYATLNLPDSSGLISEQFARAAGTGEARFTQIHIANSLGEISNTVNFRDTFDVRIKVNVKQPLKNVLFWLKVIDTQDEKDIVIAESSKDVMSLDQLGPGTHELNVALNTLLIPGDYALSAGLYTEKGMAIDAVDNVFQFRVLKTAADGKSHYRWEKPYGYVFANSNWKK